MHHSFVQMELNNFKKAIMKSLEKRRNVTMTTQQILGFTSMPEENINSDTPGKFSTIHFRIDGNGYDGSGRMEWPKHIKAAYTNEVRDIFTSQGWAVIVPLRSSAAASATKGKSSLYLHPQDFSGVCENEERESLFQLLKAAKTFECRNVDVYHEVHDMSDEQLMALCERVGHQRRQRTVRNPTRHVCGNNGRNATRRA